MADKLTIQELSVALAEKNGIDRKDAETFIKAMFDLIEESLEKDKYVKVKGFGVFKLISVNNRESVNINTGERFEIQEHYKVSFIPDPVLKGIINKPFEFFDSVVLNDGTELENTEEVAEYSDKAEDSTEEALADEVSGDETEEPLTGEDSMVEDKPLVEKEPLVDVEDKPAVEENEIEESQETEQQPDEPVEDSVKPEEESIKPVEEPIKQEEELPNAVEASEVPITEPTGTKDEEAKSGDTPTAKTETEKKPKGKGSKGWLIAACFVIGLGVGVYAFYTFRNGEDNLTKVAPKQVSPTSAVAVPEVINTDTVAEADTLQVALVQTDTLTKKVADVETTPVVSKQTTPVVSQPTTPVASKPQSDNKGKYAITGLKCKHKVKSGETIRKISLKYYGTKALSHYIVEYNNIQEPDKVGIGTVLKIPELKAGE